MKDPVTSIFYPEGVSDTFLQNFGNHQGFIIQNITIGNYLHSAVQNRKIIIFC